MAWQRSAGPSDVPIPALRRRPQHRLSALHLQLLVDVPDRARVPERHAEAVVRRLPAARVRSGPDLRRGGSVQRVGDDQAGRERQPPARRDPVAPGARRRLPHACVGDHGRHQQRADGGRDAPGTGFIRIAWTAPTGQVLLSRPVAVTRASASSRPGGASASARPRRRRADSAPRPPSGAPTPPGRVRTAQHPSAARAERAEHGDQCEQQHRQRNRATGGGGHRKVRQRGVGDRARGGADPRARAGASSARGERGLDRVRKSAK